LKPFLDRSNLNYPYEAVRLVAKETPGHFWAEVNINGNWKNFDGSGSDKRISTKEEFIDVNDFEVVDWASKDMSETLENYSSMLKDEETLRINTDGNSDFEEFSQGQTISDEEEEEYIGITDELGNTNRAANIDDFMQGKALAPYMKNCEDSCEFIIADKECEEDCDVLDEEPARCYEECANEEFYIVCDYICEDASDNEWPACYEACSGNSLDLSCDNSCWDD